MRTTLRTEIDERTTPIYTATIKDAEGMPIPLAQITTLTLTLFDNATGSIINGRSNQDILNTNGVVVEGTSGKLTWTMSELDTTIGNTASFYESRIGQFVWTYGGGKRGSHEILFTIRNLEKIV
jgi:hypothetical protein